ncbi:hypothetical protein ACFQX7_03135 [Luedemannella flava]
MLRTALVVLLGALFVALNTAIGYVMVGATWVAISTGVLLCLLFVVAVRALHRATWLSVLSLLPAFLVLVGSVQLAPELVLQQRGERHEVTILADRVVGKSHSYLLGSDKVSVLAEPLTYSGDYPPYKAGDRLTVVIDPRGVVELEDASMVDPAGKVTALVMGLTGWTLIALLAGWRGHRRRHRRARQVRHDPRGGLVGELVGGFADGD